MMSLVVYSFTDVTRRVFSPSLVTFWTQKTYAPGSLVISPVWFTCVVSSIPPWRLRGDALSRASLGRIKQIGCCDKSALVSRPCLRLSKSVRACTDLDTAAPCSDEPACVSLRGAPASPWERHHFRGAIRVFNICLSFCPTCIKCLRMANWARRLNRTGKWRM